MTTTKTSTNHVCPHRFAGFLDNWVRRLVQPPGKIVGAYVDSGQTVVDLGCGPGFFAVEMAKRVGPAGRVIAVDLQEEMLARVVHKARKNGVDRVVEPFRCRSDRIGLNCRADFVLAFYMVHEAPDTRNLLAEIRTLLKPGGRVLAVEPRWHVSSERFAAMVETAEGVGLEAVDFPGGKGGRAVLFSAGGTGEGTPAAAQQRG